MAFKLPGFSAFTKPDVRRTIGRGKNFNKAKSTGTGAAAGGGMTQKGVDEYKRKNPGSKLKKHFNRPRPAKLASKLNLQLDEIKLKSMDSPAYPSGHATQATLLSLALSDKYPNKASQLKTAANNTIKSRHLAHTHYKSDSDMGKKLGKAMYEHIKDKI